MNHSMASTTISRLIPKVCLQCWMFLEIQAPVADSHSTLTQSVKNSLLSLSPFCLMLKSPKAKFGKSF